MFWLALLIAGIGALGIRRIQNGMNAVVIRFGRPASRIIGPGITIVWPFIDRIRSVPVDPLSVSLTPQSAITKDEIPIQLQASLDARVADIQLAATVRDWRILIISNLQALMKDRLEELDFDRLDELFPNWIEGIRSELRERSAEIGVQITGLRISNLSPRTKPA
jgi:regulator of protease activity HflC (stomatin/prohibitin superfamily)